MKALNSILTLTLLLSLSNCKNNQNEMMKWTASIPTGSKLAAVQAEQPDYLEIDWFNADSLENGKTRYFITKIEGFNDPLGMTYYLEFENGQFTGQFAHK